MAELNPESNRQAGEALNGNPKLRRTAAGAEALIKERRSLTGARHRVLLYATGNYRLMTLQDCIPEVALDPAIIEAMCQEGLLEVVRTHDNGHRQSKTLGEQREVSSNDARSGPGYVD